MAIQREVKLHAPGTAASREGLDCDPQVLGVQMA